MEKVNSKNLSPYLSTRGVSSPASTARSQPGKGDTRGNGNWGWMLPQKIWGLLLPPPRVLAHTQVLSSPIMMGGRVKSTPMAPFPAGIPTAWSHPFGEWQWLLEPSGFLLLDSSSKAAQGCRMSCCSLTQHNSLHQFLPLPLQPAWPGAKTLPVPGTKTHHRKSELGKNVPWSVLSSSAETKLNTGQARATFSCALAAWVP